jgi:hypothetical protein
MLKPTKGKGTVPKPRKPGGKVKRLWWHGKLTSSWSDVSQAQSLRVVPKVGSLGLVSVFLTVPTPGKYRLELYRAGESENEFIRVDKPSSVFFEVNGPNQRVELEPQLDPKDLAFAIEGLIRVVSE